VADPLIEPEQIVIDVGGIPAPQGSMRAMLIKGKPVLVPGGSNANKKALKEWRGRIVYAVRDWLSHHHQEPLDEPLKIDLTFFMPMVESDRFRTRHATFPDKDKLTRAVFDALTDSGLVKDDSRFFDIHTRALYALPGNDTGCRITIWPCGWQEAADREVIKALRSRR
jgi:Holliday junction resolvase RusA-like endonuclease